MTPIRSDSVCKERRHTDDDSPLDKQKQKQGTSKVAAFIYSDTTSLFFCQLCHSSLLSFPLPFCLSFFFGWNLFKKKKNKT
jgi:hypothetical protein